MITEDDLMPLQDRIRVIMSEMEGPERGKQKRLADYAGADRQVVNHWLSGVIAEMRYEHAKNIEESLGYCVDWLIRGKGPRKRKAPSPEDEKFLTYVTTDENRLLDRFRSATSLGKQIIMATADGAPKAPPPSPEPEPEGGED
jgi:hypothetical protein